MPQFSPLEKLAHVPMIQYCRMLVTC